MTTAHAPVGVISIGRKALIATRRALLQDLGERGMERLQEIGCAAGEEVYESFSRWLPEFAGVRSADELDASVVGRRIAKGGVVDHPTPSHFAVELDFRVVALGQKEFSRSDF